jgi:hypothetical protein
VLEKRIGAVNLISENSVQVVITSGHPHSGYRLVHKALESAGIQSAHPSRRELLTPEALTEGILRAYNADQKVASRLEQISPGKVWEDLAVDLFLGNLSQESWGWADANTTWLLDFWLRFDGQTRFVLVYSDLGSTLADMILKAETTIDSLSAAVQSWIRWNTELLRFSARHSERCLLANAVALPRCPGALVGCANDFFSLHLIEPSNDVLTKAKSPSVLATFLTDLLLEDFHEALALYDELESAAHLAGSFASERSVAVKNAWGEYLESASNLRQVQEQRSQFILRNKALTEENELLFLQLRQLQERYHQLEGDLQVAESSRDDARRQLEELHGRIVASQQATAEIDERTSQFILRNKALTEENELLFLQLRQLQDALDQTVSAHHESERQRLELATSAARVAETTVPARARSHLAELALDMRNEIEGNNWYWAEHDGRWAGPGTHGTLRLPAMGPGRYEVNLDVVDAMDPDILAGMQVMLCGVPLLLARKGKRYPTTLKGVVMVEDVRVEGDWDMSFQFPSVLSPAQRGASDRRQLAIRLRSVRLRALRSTSESSNLTN